MTATEMRADALLWLADVQRDGYDVTTPLLAIFTGVDPSVYRVHWDRVVQLVAEENDIRTAKVDDSHPVLSRLSVGERGEKADELADEVRSDARSQALCCVMVATRHAAAKYTTGSAA